MPANTIQPLALLSVDQWKAVEKIVAEELDHQQARLVEEVFDRLAIPARSTYDLRDIIIAAWPEELL